MNRRQRRAIVKKHAKRGLKKVAERELKRRTDEKWSEDCTFDRHKKCAQAGCPCPHHSSKISDTKGRVVENVEVRDSGILVARNPGIIRPGR